jgi:hypothetical protein
MNCLFDYIGYLMNKCLLLLLIVLTAQSLTAQTKPTDTDGDGFYNISTLDHLRWVSENESSWSWNFELDNDIDARDTRNWNVGDHDNWSNTPDEPMGWLPVGITEEHPFTGSFNGNGFAVSGLYSNAPAFPEVGLFGYISGEQSVISDITLTNIEFYGAGYTGGIVGVLNTGTIKNAAVDGKIGCMGYFAGGIAGLCNETGIIYSASVEQLSISGAGPENGTPPLYLGGLVGANSGLIELCRTEADITGYYTVNIGGITAYNTGLINDCYTFSEVYCEQGKGTSGGFAGMNYGMIRNSYSAGSVNGNEISGGFVAENEIVNNGNVITGETPGCFWNSDLAEQQNSKGGQKVNTKQMKEKALFLEAEWNFIDRWTMHSEQNNGFPYFIKDDTGHAPDAPEFISPENNSEDMTNDFIFQWSQVKNIDFYVLSIYSAAEDSLYSYVVTENLMAFPEELFRYNSNYAWGVIACRNTGENSSQQTPFNFSTQKIGSPTLQAPLDGNEKESFLFVDFSWDAVFDAESYILEISEHPDFSSLAVTIETENTSEQVSGELLPNRKYFWRVKATSEDPALISDWSEVFDFSTQDLSVAIVSPQDKAIIEQFPLTINWSVDPRSDYLYSIQLASDSLFSDIVFEKNGLDSDEISIYEDELGEEIPEIIYLRVSVVYKSYTSDFSVIRSFVISKSKIWDTVEYEVLSISPNPAVDKICICSSSAKGELEGVSIYDNTGNIVYSGAFGDIDISDWPAGVYFVKACGKGGRCDCKFVKI